MLSPQPAMRRPFVLTSLAMLTGACILMPYPSFAGDNCSQALVTSRQCHLDLNDRMKMDMGTWGIGVHPHGPNYFCVQRHKQLEEERKRACPQH
jgi:hypothetical protein